MAAGARFVCLAGEKCQAIMLNRVSNHVQSLCTIRHASTTLEQPMTLLLCENKLWS